MEQFVRDADHHLPVDEVNAPQSTGYAVAEEQLILAACSLLVDTVEPVGFTPPSSCPTPMLCDVDDGCGLQKAGQGACK